MGVIGVFSVGDFWFVIDEIEFVVEDIECYGGKNWLIWFEGGEVVDLGFVDVYGE